MLRHSLFTVGCVMGNTPEPMSLYSWVWGHIVFSPIFSISTKFLAFTFELMAFAAYSYCFFVLQYVSSMTSSWVYRFKKSLQLLVVHNPNSYRFRLMFFLYFL